MQATRDVRITLDMDLHARLTALARSEQRSARSQIVYLIAEAVKRQAQEKTTNDTRQPRRAA